MELLEVVCPPGAREGELIHAETADGRPFDVVVPAGVHEGEAFQVELHADSSAPTGLKAIAAAIEEARAIAAQFFGDVGAAPRKVEGGEVLAEALKSILRSLEYADEIDQLIDGHSAAFAEYSPDGEQQLAWTELHQQYVTLVQHCISKQLEEMECSEEEVFEYAKVYGGDPAADRFLTKLLALGDYSSFCSMMQQAHVRGPMSV